MRRYLTQQGVSSHLMQRLQRNAVYMLAEREKRMSEQEVELLGVISQSLRIELHFEIYSVCLSTHDFFQVYTEECPHVVRHICHRAVSVLVQTSGDVVFCAGEIPVEPKMYIVRRGELRYDSIHDDDDECEVGKDRHISEAALWTMWVHRGLCVAASDAILLTICGKKFASIVNQFHVPEFDPIQYGKAFVNDLNTFKTFVTDITTMREMQDMGKHDSEVVLGRWLPRFVPIRYRRSTIPSSIRMSTLGSH